MADIGINVTATRKGNAVEETRREIDRLASELKRLEGALEGSGRELAQSIEKYRQAQRESIALKGEFRKLRQSGEGTEEMFRNLTERIDRAQDAERVAIEETRRLAAAFRDSEGETEQWADELRFLNEQLDRSQGYIDGISISAKRSEAAMQGMTGEVRQANSELRQIGQTGERAADGINRTANAAEELNRKGAGMVAFGGIMEEAFEEAFYAVKQFAEDSVQEFFDVDRGIREVSTLIPGATGEMREALLEDIQLMSIGLGRMSEETIPAVYQALSSGRGTETVLEDVALASEAARAGVAELDDTMTSGLAVMNAYGEEAYNLQEIYDQFFYGIKEGVFTMSDLAGGMSELTSISAETKTPLEDIMAALIVMTRQGDSFNEAVELSGLLLTQLGTEGSAAANTFLAATGQSYREFIAQGGTLGEALQRIQEHADRTGQSIGGMIAGNSPFYRDQQAARAALELTGIHLQEVTDFAEGARDAAGSMGEASAIMGESAETGALRAAAAWDVFKGQMGELIYSDLTIAFGQTMEDLVSHATNILGSLTGAHNTQTESLIENNLAQVGSMEGMIAELDRLDQAWSMDLLNITGTHDAIEAGGEQVMQSLMSQFATYDEWIAYLGTLTTEQQDLIQNWGGYSMRVFEEYRAGAFAAAQGWEPINYAVAQAQQQIRDFEWPVTEAQEFAEAGRENEAVLVNQSVAAQEAMHGLDIYREAMNYAGDAAASTTGDIDLSTEAMREQALELAGYWQQAGTLVDGWVAAQDQGAAAIIASNDAISASYEETFFEAMLANQGLTQSTLDLMVQRGYLTQEEADLRLEISGNNQALTELTQSQAFNKLTTEEQSTAIDALITGMAQSSEAAINLATNGYSPLTGTISDARTEATLLKDDLDYLATIVAAPEVDMNLSGQISQAQHLRDLLEDLSQHGSGGGYGGIQNPDGGTTGGGNIPEYASGGYTGNYGGLVHPNEYVFDPQATSFYGPGMLREMQAAAQDNRQFNLGGDTIIVNDYGGGQARQALEAGASTRQQRLYQSLRLQ